MSVISVIMSIYNEKKEWVEEAINSILSQTFSDFEFIIINDNPQRELNKELLDKYRAKDDRIIIIENEQNIGLTKSLNKGLKIANGKYIARMDADDISMPDRFAKQVEFLDNHEDYIVCGAYVQTFGSRKRLIKFGQDWQDLKTYFLIPNPTSSPVAHPAAMIRASVLRSNNFYYNEDYRVGQDYELWSRLMFLGKFYNIPKVLLHYRISPSQISSVQTSKQQDIVRRLASIYIERYFEELNLNISPELDLNIILSTIKENKDNLEIKSFLLSILGYNLIYNVNNERILILLYFLRQKKISLRLKASVLYRFFKQFLS